MNCGCSCDKQLQIDWNNDLTLPPFGGMSPNVGLAGAFAGFAGEKLIVAGGANFPDGFPWTGGTKTWWAASYALDTTDGTWSVDGELFPQPMGYGTSVQLPDGVLCIGGCNAKGCYAGVSKIALNAQGAPEFIENIFPDLPVTLANSAGALLGDKIYLAGGQESMTGEESTNHFFVLDLREPTAGWKQLPSWPGPSRGYAVCAVQNGKFFLFSGRSYGPGQPTVMHRDGYCYDPESGTWSALDGDFPVMAGTATPWGDDKILFLGGVDEILPTTPDHPGFSRLVRALDVKTGEVSIVTESPYPIPVTTTTVRRGAKFYIASGEVRPGVRTPQILTGNIE